MEGCPKSPELISSCSASEISLGREVYVRNNECRTIEVMMQDWSSEVVALFLVDWELGRVAWRCARQYLLHDWKACGLSRMSREACDMGPSIPVREWCLKAG